MGKAIELGRQIGALDSSIYAAKVIAKRPTNAISYCVPIERILAYKHLFSPSNRQLLLKLISEILGHAETSWQGIDVPSNKEALEKEMQQLIDIIRRETVAWRLELGEMSPDDTSTE